MEELTEGQSVSQLPRLSEMQPGGGCLAGRSCPQVSVPGRHLANVGISTPGPPLDGGWPVGRDLVSPSEWIWSVLLFHLLSFRQDP